MCLKNVAGDGTSISYRSEQMFVIVHNEACYSQPTQWLGEMILLAWFF
jgi:hypothetical protein